MPKGAISRENIALCEEIFQAAIKDTEGMSTFSWHVWADVGGGEYEQNPNDPDVSYFLYLYEQPQEFVGGKDDGATGYSGFTTDLNRLIGLFKPMADHSEVLLSFSATLHMEEDPSFVIQGNYKGRDFIVHLQAYPPKDAEVGMKVHSDGSFSFPDDDDEDEDEK